MSESPTTRSLKALRADGWTVAIVEKWNSHTRIRQDLFGFADLLAIKAGEVPRLYQVTSGANTSSRVSKILENETSKTCLLSGMRIFVTGWRKLKVKRGGKAMRWAPKEVEIKLEDFEDADH